MCGVAPACPSRSGSTHRDSDQRLLDRDFSSAEARYVPSTSRTAAAPVASTFRPRYTSLVMEVLAWPSWSAAAREDRPGLVHHGGDGFAEDVGGHPVEARVGEGLAQVGLRVQGIAPATQGSGEHGPVVRAALGDGHRAGPGPEHRGAPLCEYQGSGAGVGLRRLDDQTSTFDADRGGAHVDGASSRSTASQARSFPRCAVRWPS